jgi:aspartate dehydrogenase
MTSSKGKIKLGIVGCGAIGSRIALSVKKELKSKFMIAAVYDTDTTKAETLAARFDRKIKVARNLDELIRSSEMIVEAVNTQATQEIVKRSLKARKHILAMSIGRLLNNSSLFSLAERSHSSLLLPSGAIAGLDAVKSAAIAGITSITLTSRKPPAGFSDNRYVIEKKLLSKKTKNDVVLFDGNVSDAVKFFPQNINVAAAIAIAAGPKAKLHVKIIASPGLKRNTHEIVLDGAFGRITTKCENTVCPDNPKTSYLAVLSGIRTLQQFALNVRIGT